MLVEVFRIHPSCAKEAAEVERYNRDHFVIHPNYVKRVVDLSPGLYVASSKYKMVKDGWLTKAVYELMDPFSDAPSMFIRKPFYERLRELNRFLAIQ